MMITTPQNSLPLPNDGRVEHEEWFRLRVRRYLAMVARCLVSLVFSASIAAAAPATVTVESIQTRLSELSQDTRLAAEMKPKILATYTNALTWAKIAAEKKKVADDFSAARLAAPELLKEITQSTPAAAAKQSPSILTNTPLKSLEALLAATDADLAAAAAKLAGAREEPKRRATRRLELATVITETKAKLDELAAIPDPVSGPESNAELLAATSALTAARQQALTAELNAATEELLYLDASSELSTAQADQAARQLSQFDARAELLRQAIAQRRRLDAQAAVAEAERQRQSISPAAPTIPLIAKLATENAALAAQRVGAGSVAKKIEVASASLEEIRLSARNLDDTFRSIERRVQSLERAGRSIDESTGLLLRKSRANLPETRRLVARNGAVQEELSQAQLATFDLQDQRAKVSDLPGRAKALVAEAGVPAAQREEAEKAVTELLQARRGYLDALLGDHETYLRTLIELETAQRNLTRASSRVAKYIDERVLWIRSAPRYSLRDFEARVEMLQERFPLSGWAELGRFLWDDIRQNPFLIAFVTAFFVSLFLLKRKVVRALGEFSREAAQGRNSSFRPTVSAMLGTLLVSTIFPLLFGYFAWRLSGADATGFIRSVSDGLAAVAIVHLTLEFYRQVCRRNGLGEAHFGWAKHNTGLANYHLKWLIFAMLPLTFFVAAIEGRGQEASFGQFFFILIMVCLAIFAHCLLRPGDGLRMFSNRSGEHPRLARLAHVVGVAVPLVLGLAAWFGYYYTTLELSWRFEATVWVTMSVLLLNALILRWFVLARRRWAIEQSRKRRVAQEETRKSGKTDSLDETPPVDTEISLSKLDAQTRSLIRLFIGLVLVLGLWGIWSGVFPALTAFNRVELWQLTPTARADRAEPAGESNVEGQLKALGETLGVTETARPAPIYRERTAVTLADLLWCFAVIALAVAAVKNIPGFLELTILNRVDLEPGMSYAITTVVRYLIALVGLLMAFGALGVTWSKVQWLAAAMTVGIGFGLQEIFANFVSGLIILFERPIRLGDIVTVGDVSGTVTRINIRATTVTDWDRREFVIPNKEFITGKLLNWTLTDPITRVVVPVGIAYGSDTALAEKLLLKMADENPHVMKDPAPRAVFTGFGDNSLDFKLYVYIPRRNFYHDMLHALTNGINREFNAAGINIAFPQRDVHLHPVGPLEVRMAREDEKSPSAPENPKPDQGK